MKVLLTGATGFIGQHVLKCLTREKIPVVALGRQLPPDVDCIQADLLATSDFTALVEKAGATHLLHLAWYAEHGSYWTSALNLRWVEASVRLVEAFCQRGGRQVVVSGTCAEYDWSHGYCREDITPVNPSTLYGIAKDATRRLVTAICSSHGANCTWGRVFIPYGPGEASARLVPSLIDMFLGKRDVFGINAQAYRDFLYVSDVAEAFLTLLRVENAGIFNICSGHPVQLAAMALEIASQLNGDPLAVLDLSLERQDEPALLVGENKKLKALGWQTKVALPSGIGLYICEARK